MVAYIKPFATKTVVFAIALLTCHGCLVVPVSVQPAPVLPDNSDKATTTHLEPGWEKTCFADAPNETKGRKITASSNSLETAADKLAATGKHKEAIRKYGEAGAAALNEAIADGTVEEMENFTGDAEDFRAEHHPLLQSTAEANFKIGQSYAQLGKYENAIDCFNGTIKIGILPPNDAIAYLNRGDAYEKMGVKDKAKADFQQAVNLFKKYKLPSYQKLAEGRLRIVKTK